MPFLSQPDSNLSISSSQPASFIEKFKLCVALKYFYRWTNFNLAPRDIRHFKYLFCNIVVIPSFYFTNNLPNIFCALTKSTTFLKIASLSNNSKHHPFNLTLNGSVLTIQNWKVVGWKSLCCCHPKLLFRKQFAKYFLCLYKIKNFPQNSKFKQ